MAKVEFVVLVKEVGRRRVRRMGLEAEVSIEAEKKATSENKAKIKARNIMWDYEEEVWKRMKEEKEEEEKEGMIKWARDAISCRKNKVKLSEGEKKSFN